MIVCTVKKRRTAAGLLVLLAPLVACAQAKPGAFVITAKPETMIQGEDVPPLVYEAIPPSGSNARSTSPPGALPAISISTTATSTSPPGSYPIHVRITGQPPTDYALSTADSTLQVLPGADPNGARLNNAINRPKGVFREAAALAASIGLTLYGDYTHDDTAALQAIMQLQYVPAPTRLVKCSIAATTLSCTTAAPHSLKVGNTVQLTATSDPTVNSAGLQVCKITASLGPTDFSCTVSSGDASSTGGYVSSARVHNGEYFRAGQFIHLPAGRYKTTQNLHEPGCCVSFAGDGPYKTIIEVPENTPAFQTTDTDVITWPGRLGNQGFRLNITGIGVHIHAGNPHARAIGYIGNNTATIENVAAWCDDSQCPTIFNFRFYANGPMLIKNVIAVGGRCGLEISQSEYSTTAEGLTIMAQTVAGVCISGQPDSFRHVLSSNRVPAFALKSGSAAIVDSEFLNGAPGNNAILSANQSATYVRNIVSSGYQHAVADSGSGSTVLADSPVGETWTGSAQTLFSRAKAQGIRLPVKETPIPVDPPASTWCLLGAPSTWQATVNSCTSGVAYAVGETASGTPNTTYEVIVPKTLKHVILFDRTQNPSTSFVSWKITTDAPTPFWLENTGYNAALVTHTGARTLVLRHGTFVYNAAPGAGDLYGEDVQMGGTLGTPQAGVHFYKGQNVYIRQFDNEVRPGSADAPKTWCDGATCWFLGYKTEAGGVALLTTGGGHTEVLGCMIYPVSTQPDQSVMFSAVDSEFGAYACRESVHGKSSGYSVLMDEVKSGVHRQIPATSQGASQNLPFFYSVREH